MHEILEILYENAKATPSEIAALLGKSEEEVAREIKEMEDAGIIRKYITLINWEKLDQSVVFAVLELKVALQRKTGDDAVGREGIARFSEVESVRLISGGHDLSVTVRGKSMKDIAYFVAEKIAPDVSSPPAPISYSRAIRSMGLSSLSSPSLRDW